MRWDLKRWNIDNERREKLEKKHTADKKKSEETKKIQRMIEG